MTLVFISWEYSQTFLKRPGFGEELIMIAFWESELDGREVFYHSITGEDTGEDVFEVSARITVA